MKDLNQMWSSQLPKRKDSSSPVKSGNVHTVDTIVSKCIMLLHDDVVYSVAGKPAVYDEIAMPLFVHGYLIMMKGERDSVKTKTLGKGQVFPCHVAKSAGAGQTNLGRCRGQVVV